MTGLKLTRVVRDVRKRKGQGDMKELVDRILAGDVVDVSSDNPVYYLSVLKEPSGFKIGFVAPSDLAGQDAQGSRSK